MSDAKRFYSLEEYQDWVAKATYGNTDKYGLLYGGCALAGEAGEVANICKKVARDNDLQATPTQKTALFDEIGDVIWYVTFICNQIGATLEDVIDANITKINKRAYERELLDAQNNQAKAAE